MPAASRLIGTLFVGQVRQASRRVGTRQSETLRHEAIVRYSRGMKHTKRPASIRPLAAILLAIAVAGAPACRKAPPLTSGIDLAGMDTSVAPGDDFNAYANGGWIKATPIPADKPSYGIGDILVDETRKRTLALIQEAAQAGSAASGDTRKIGDFYASFMDEAAIESKGIAPLKPQFDAIAAIADRHDLARVLGGQLRADVDPLNDTNFETRNLFGVWVTQGLTDPSHSFPYLLQGGLGMPDRDYYLSTTPHMAELRNEYQAHIAATFKLAGFDDPEARAARVFALETKMAAVHATRVESEDVHGAVSWKREELAAKAPGLDWAALLDAAGLKDAPVFIIWHPKAVPGLSALAAAEPLDAWKDWLRVPCHRTGRGLPSQGVRRRALQLLWQGPQRHSGAAPALAAGRGLHQSGARRGGRQAVRGALLPAADQGQGAGDGWRSGEGVRQEDRRAHLDVARDQGQSETEAGHAESRRRLSRPVAGLLGPRNRQGRRARATRSAPSFSNTAASSPSSTSRWTAASGG